MKITTTKDGTVSFLQMTPTLAGMLVDLANDLAEGRARLIYDPELVGRPDGVFAYPTYVGETELKKVGEAYDAPAVNIEGKPWEETFATHGVRADAETFNRWSGMLEEMTDPVFIDRMVWKESAWRDPTAGQVDRDIQERVELMRPTSMGQRAAMESTLQARRDGR